jgi:hypothetical protein
MNKQSRIERASRGGYASAAKMSRRQRVARAKRAAYFRWHGMPIDSSPVPSVDIKGKIAEFFRRDAIFNAESIRASESRRKTYVTQISEPMKGK